MFATPVKILPKTSLFGKGASRKKREKINDF